MIDTTDTIDTMITITMTTGKRGLAPATIITTRMCGTLAITAIIYAPAMIERAQRARGI